MTRVLNRAGLPFRFKVVNDPQGYTRCDAGVLYIARSDYPAVASALERIYSDLVEMLRPGVPALTKPLAPGLGLAEDPGTEDSFGMHRCGLLADALIRAHEQRKRSVESRLSVVAERFAEAGISLDEPFLNAGSRDEYSFQPQPNPHMRSSGKTRPSVSGATTYIGVAKDIGRRLVREAIWHEERCNWIGPELATATTHEPGGTVYRALGPEIYAGTSGIAWFLAELAAINGEVETRRTALGAVRQALLRADADPSVKTVGPYTGYMGIALAAAHVGTLLNEAEPLERAARLARQVLDGS